MSLGIVWFIIVAVFWTGFFILEGFDFGVGVLHKAVGRTNLERRVAINTIGPLWDGNEVWLIVAGAAIFAAFPDWYATWFSAGYLALFLVLVALIVRGVSFEWRNRVDTDGWRRTWSWTLTIGSALIPLLLGVALGDLLAGLPINSSDEFTGSFWDLLTPYGLWLGLTLLLLCLLHGATFLTLKASATVRQRAREYAARLSWPAVGAVAVYTGWTLILSDAGDLADPRRGHPGHSRHRRGPFHPHQPGRPFLRGDNRHHRRHRRVPVRERLPQRDGLLDHQRQQPDRRWHGVQRLRTQGHDRRGRRHLPRRSPLPRLVLLGLPRPHHHTPEPTTTPTTRGAQAS